ncbi:MAG: hypothetical protein COA63_000655 [Methylophaga sp.]|nr:hypothetical protein [Methylophaga sp.]
MNKDILTALIELSPLSMTKIAVLAEIDQGNLSYWLKDKRTLSSEAQHRLTVVLGVEGGELVTDKVFFRKTERDFSRLQQVIDSLFSKAKIMPLVKQRVKRYELSDLFAQPMTALTNNSGQRAVIVLKTPIVKDLKYSGELPWLSPVFLAGTAWLQEIENGSSMPFPTPVQLDKAMYQRWKSGDIKVDEFNVLLSETQSVTWNTVIDEAIRRNMSPEQLLNVVSNIIN